MKSSTIATIAAAFALVAPAFAAERPELTAYPYQRDVAAAGSYEAAATGENFVVSGAVAGDVTITATQPCRITLSDSTLNGTLAIDGDAQLWLVGANSITTEEESAISSTGTLTIGGTGTLALSAPGGKKTGVIAAADLVLAGGNTTVTISNPTAKNACGVSLSGNYSQLAGTLKITGSSNEYKQNGVFLSKKNKQANISGGVLDVSLAGEKSVGLALDKDSTTADMSGGVLRFAMSGDGAKGVKGDGAFTMSGGLIDATLTGGYVEDLLEYEDGDGNVWNYYVALTSSTKTSGGSKTYNTSALINSGTYAVYDPSKAYAVKVGSLAVSGGLVRVRCTGTCGRGLGADSMTLSGGVYDISVAGGPTDVYVESLVEADELTDDTYASAVATCLDAGGAACLKTSGDLAITGGTFELKATGTAGKLINVGGILAIGGENAATHPTDSAFSPDIQGQALGSKIFCTAVKQKYYGSLATATATTNISAVACSTASSNVVSGSGDDVDYSNPKGIKAESGLVVNSGRLRIYTANDGGEGLESKDVLTINGGVIELVCADDCINSGGDLEINGGYIYAGSTGNDGIDSNGTITINGGYVLAFTATTPEVGIDLDDRTGLSINGGCVFSIGSATDMAYGSSGTQKSYLSTNATLTPNSYIGLAGTNTVYAKVPASSSSSLSCSVMCSVPGTSSSPSLITTSSPSGTAIGFHGIYEE